MKTLGSKDGQAGILLAVWGLFFAAYSHFNYPLGTLRQIGPGMFPLVLGLLLMVLGLGILAKAFLVASDRAWFDIRSALYVLGALSLGALMLGYLGLVPALFLVVFLSAAGTAKLGILQNILYSALVVGVLVALFVHGLKLNLVLFRFPS